MGSEIVAWHYHNAKLEIPGSEEAALKAAFKSGVLYMEQFNEESQSASRAPFQSI